MNSIELLSERIVEEACELNASDIHFVPRETDAVIQYRIDDDLIEKRIIRKEVCGRIIAHFKFLASMDIGERRRPQNGSLALSNEAINVQLRMSTLPTVFEESLVIRILPNDCIPSVTKLSLFPQSAQKLLSFLNHSHGLMVFTGPTRPE